MKNYSKMKAIILARVSTEEQKEAGNSLPAQLLRLEKYCNEHKLEIYKQYEFDESAWKEERKKFEKIMAILKDAKEPMALCCDKIDRLIRNFTSDLIDLEELRKQGKIELHFYSDNIVLYKDSPATDLFRFQIGVSLASYYSNSISDNVKRANETKIKKGEWCGNAPIGYLNTEDNNGNKDIEPDPVRSPYIIKMFEMYSTGNYSFALIQEEMEKLGLRSKSKNPQPLTKSSVFSVLNNPFYYGMMEIKEKLYPHKYQPLIKKELFDKCQKVMASYKKKPCKYGAKPFIFRGLIKCAICGCTITPETSKNHIYYSCTNYHKAHEKRVYVPENELLEPIYELLDNIQLTDQNKQELVEALKITTKAENKFFTNTLKYLRQEYDKLENMISNLADDKYSESITEDFYNKKLKQYSEKQAKILQEINKHNEADKDHYFTINTILSLAQRAKEIFESSETEEKRHLLNFLLQNLELRNKTLKYELKTPFNTIIFFKNKTKSRAFNPASSVWLRGSDSNRRPID